jgi:hypothetical protein
MKQDDLSDYDYCTCCKRNGSRHWLGCGGICSGGIGCKKNKKVNSISDVWSALQQAMVLETYFFGV